MRIRTKPRRRSTPADRLTLPIDAYDDSSKNYTQTVTVDGKVISSLESSSGKAIGWGTAVEAQNELSGTVTAHSKPCLPL